MKPSRLTPIKTDASIFRIFSPFIPRASIARRSVIFRPLLMWFRRRRCRELMRSFLTPCVIFRVLPRKKVLESRKCMRADRLLSIMLLLQTYRRMTAHDLAERLEVSERTIHRDMESLSAGGGWSLMGEYRTNLTGLNEAEIQALFLARSPRLLDDLGLGKAAEAAFIK